MGWGGHYFSHVPHSRLLHFLLLIYSKPILLFMCGCWEMINDGVPPNKYEIPGSLAGLDWREKCIISPWTPRSQGVIDIVASVHPHGHRGRQRERQQEDGGRDGESS